MQVLASSKKFIKSEDYVLKLGMSLSVVFHNMEKPQYEVAL